MPLIGIYCFYQSKKLWKLIICWLLSLLQIQLRNYKSMEGKKFTTLHYMLAYNKYPEIIRTMLKETYSKRIYTEYFHGYMPDNHQQTIPKFKYQESIQSHRIMKLIQQFTLGELIEIKGSPVKNPKYYQNTILIELIKKKLVTQDPTPKLREKLWIQFTDIYKMQDLYAGLMELQLPIQFENNIAKDINRTSTTPQRKKEATEVLRQFAKYNPFISYCQGMNYIVVFILQNNFSRQQTFFILKKLTQILVPNDYYTNMNTTITDVRIMFELLAQVKPKIYKKLQDLMKNFGGGSYMVVMSFVFQWFVCLFTNMSIHRNISRIIWDSLLLEGSVVFFKAALTFFDFLQQRILKEKTFESYIKMIQEVTLSITDAEAFKEKMLSIYINTDILQLLRSNINKAKSDEDSLVTKKNHKHSKKKCRKSWNACMQVVENQMYTGKKNDFFIFKKNAPINIIDNYLEKLDYQFFMPPNNNYKSKTDKLMIGRMTHICQASQQQQTQDSVRQPYNISNLASSVKVQVTSPPMNQGDLKNSVDFAKQIGKIKKVRTEVKQKYRNRVIQKFDLIYRDMQIKKMQRSQSIVFMKMMAENASFTNLLDLYDSQEMLEQQQEDKEE